MADALRDETILNADREGKVFGEGESLHDTKTAELLGALRLARENLHGPKTETLTITPRMHVADFRVISENQIADIISKKWNETPDSLIPASKIVSKSDKKMLNGLLITEIFETSQTPPGLVKVMYQFARRGEYGEEEFENTGIYRLEFSEAPTLDEGPGSILEPVGAEGPVPNTRPEKKSEKLELADNQFIDPKSNLLVTYYEIPVA